MKGGKTFSVAVRVFCFKYDSNNALRVFRVEPFRLCSHKVSVSYLRVRCNYLQNVS
jgi:hypothetical protein